MFTNVDVIVYSRFWNPGKIQTALRLAKMQAPECRIVNLCDEGGDVGWPDKALYGNYLNEVMARLASVDHLWGPNPKLFEKVCVARWFVLLDWMTVTGIHTVCHCDSDNLWFSDPFKAPHYVKGRALLTSGGGGAVSAGNCIVTKEHVGAFCANALRLVAGAWHEANKLNDIVIWTMTLPEIGGFENQNCVKDGVAFDGHMGWLGGVWEPDAQGYKNLVWRDGKPRCKYLPTGEHIRLLNLHCWGASENLMERYAELGGLR
jgi:hypothetical protein